MKEVIKLNQKKKLYNILLQIPEWNLYSWRVLWISGFGKVNSNETIMNLEDEINNSKDGIFYSWESLFKFTVETLELHEFLLLGDIDPNNLHRYDDEKTMRQNCEFCIELIDSSFWEISSSNVSFLDHVRRI